jgi:hypothetical protein
MLSRNPCIKRLLQTGSGCLVGQLVEPGLQTRRFGRALLDQLLALAGEGCTTLTAMQAAARA